MQEYKIAVLGNDKQVYDAESFLASGKNVNDAIGIVFGTPIIGQRVLAFDSWIEKWGNTDSVLTEAHNESQVVQILSGFDDTKRIVEAQSDNEEMTAAKRCWNHTAGGLQWYLPSPMELGALFLVRDQVNDLMQRLGCDSDCLLPTENSDETWVWSSSENSQYNSWHVNFGNGYFGTSNKYGGIVVRAVAAFQSPSLLTGEAKSQDCLHSDEALVNMLRERGYSGTLTKTLTI